VPLPWAHPVAFPGCISWAEIGQGPRGHPRHKPDVDINPPKWLWFQPGYPGERQNSWQMDVHPKNIYFVLNYTQIRKRIENSQSSREHEAMVACWWLKNQSHVQ
jgi:hypothetical protein